MLYKIYEKVYLYCLGSDQVWNTQINIFWRRAWGQFVKQFCKSAKFGSSLSY